MEPIGKPLLPSALNSASTGFSWGGGKGRIRGGEGVPVGGTAWGGGMEPGCGY